MPNGSFAYGNTGSFSQSNLAIKKIGDDNQYFLFNSGMWQTAPFPWIPATYSVIDMSLDGGLGDVLPAFKNIPVPGGNKALNMVTGTRHYNNRDAWVVFALWIPIAISLPLTKLHHQDLIQYQLCRQVLNMFRQVICFFPEVGK
jgi:hypothetical protein